MPELWVDFAEAVEPFDSADLEKRCLLLMDAAGVTRPVNLLFCSKEESQELNRQYRGQDKPTDILSFGYEAPEEPLGDLALCLEVAREQAQGFGLALEEELLRLFAHGLVHLMGMDHQSPEEEAAMLAEERKLLASLGLEGLYS